MPAKSKGSVRTAATLGRRGTLHEGGSWNPQRKKTRPPVRTAALSMKFRRFAALRVQRFSARAARVKKLPDARERRRDFFRARQHDDAEMVGRVPFKAAARHH